MSSKLFVIGNGFDLHHGIPSRYTDFGQYVGQVAPDLLDLVNNYLCVDEDFWNCFEERLASFDSDSVIDHAEQFLVSYGAEEWSDAYHHDFEYEIEQIVDGLSAQLHARFAEWVRSLQIPQSGIVPLVRCVDPSAQFLSFNYTSTLQVLYGVPDAQILHIHGRAASLDDEIVLGHGWERSTADGLRSQVNEDTDTRVAGGYGLIDDYFERTFKPTKKLIERHCPWFDSLSNLSEVIVLGHSLADVDAPYFREIIYRIPSAQWTVSCYLEPSLEQASLAKLGVPAGRAAFAPLATL